MKKFDLNIEKILENWEMHHAIREIIANALDEQLLTRTDDVIIAKNGEVWIVRDFGRGLKYSHLTQNENKEKLSSTKVIGKFGIGLKDSLATFDRRGAIVIIKSKYGRISIEKSPKQGFQDITTLHAMVEKPIDTGFVGTEFELRGVTDDEIERAKRLFLKFSSEEVIETTRQGQVVKRNGNHGNIYINGVKVSQEENFLFSYEVKCLRLKTPRRPLCIRPRPLENDDMVSTDPRRVFRQVENGPGRSAYTASEKIPLLSSKEKKVAETLPEPELTWIDARGPGQQEGKYIFLTSVAVRDIDPVSIPENLKDKIKRPTDLSGNPIVDIGQFMHCNFVDPDQKPKILDLFSRAAIILHDEEGLEQKHLVVGTLARSAVHCNNLR